MWIGQWTCIFLNGGSLVISPTVPSVHHKSNKTPFNICRNVIPRGQGIEPNSIINCRMLTAYCLVINWFIVKHCIGVFSPEGGGVSNKFFLILQFCFTVRIKLKGEYVFLLSSGKTVICGFVFNCICKMFHVAAFTN